MKIFGKTLYDKPMEKILQFLSPFLLAICVPAGRYVILASLFVLGDLVTGVLASHKRGEPFSSRRLIDSVTKFVAYGVFILIASAIEQQFMKEFPCVKMTTMFVAYIELKSIDENAKDITGHSIFSKIIQLINPKRKA